ncbi:MAG: AraC family transcriptional regulator [Carboxylicivirga sp.]|nr:AraC family transcriptional regulator [Carboxylicivirga sp.]
MNSGIVVKDKLEARLFKVSRFKEMIKRTKPHKHDKYYELVFLFAGEGFHSIESNRYTMSMPECYFLKPGQLHFWQFTSIPRGFVLLFKDEVFDRIHDNRLLNLLMQLMGQERIEMHSVDFYDSLLTLMDSEFKAEATKEVLNGLLMALFAKLVDDADILQAEKQHSGLFERFSRLLAHEVPKLRKVSEFADRLHTTPQNLNQLCRKVQNLSASEVINQQLILEAKRYILHTDYTVSQIAEFLYFSDDSNFVKFFKKHTDLTPRQYREQYFH